MPDGAPDSHHGSSVGIGAASAYPPKERERDHAIGQASSGLRAEAPDARRCNRGPTDLTTTTEPMMSTRQPTTAALEDPPIPVRAKLAAAWTSFMFLYAYVDILGFYTPGMVDDILDGKVFEFDLSQTFSTTVLTALAIPIFMVVLSTILPARVNRILNLVVASLYVPFTVFNVAGGFYLYFYGLGVVLELILLALILRYAWTWPRTAPAATMVTSPDRGTVRAQHQA